MAKGEIARLSNFFFCHFVFKKLSAAEASESVYMRERVKVNFRKELKTVWLKEKLVIMTQ